MHLQCFATILATVLSFVYGVQARPTAYLSTPTRSLEPRASIVDVDDDWIPATTVLPVDPNYAQMTPEDQSIARAKVYSNYIRTSCIRTLQVEIEADKIIRDFESREPGSERFMHHSTNPPLAPAQLCCRRSNRADFAQDVGSVV